MALWLAGDRVSGAGARGFTSIPNVFVRDRTLPPATRLLYGVILSYSWTPRGCTASVETLCDDTGIGRTAFFDSIRVLRDRGMLNVEKRKSRNGWRNVYVPVVDLKGVTVTGDEDAGEVVRDPDEGSSVQADEGSSATRTQKKTKGEEASSADAEERARAIKNRIPDDFPDELRPHARAVLPLLRSVAVQHNSKEVLPLALARVMMAPERRRKPFVKAAHDFAAWAVDPPRPIKDVVASYRTWLDREKNLQAIERLADAPRNAGDTAGSSRRYNRED